MTVKEFYKWACENGCEDYDLMLTTSDGFGYNYEPVFVDEGAIDIIPDHEIVMIFD